MSVQRSEDEYLVHLKYQIVCCRVLANDELLVTIYNCVIRIIWHNYYSKFYNLL